MVNFIEPMIKMIRKVKVKYKKGSRVVNVNGYSILVRESLVEIQEVVNEINKSQEKKGKIITRTLEL